MDGQPPQEAFVDPTIVVFTEQEMMRIGLDLFYKDGQRIDRAAQETNEERFRYHLGASPLVVLTIWMDLQTRDDIPDAYVPPGKRVVLYYLMSFNFLKHYDEQTGLESRFDRSKKTCSEWIWYFVERIQALKVIKIVWPPDNFGECIWGLSVDGIHGKTNERRHPEYSQDPSLFSHKEGKAGLGYELGIALASSSLIWMNGPFPAGRNDISIFTQEGLEEKLASIGKRAIGDLGYAGHNDTISTPNPYDPRPLRKFKSRALKRHETFNNLLKRFAALDPPRGGFRHTSERYKNTFEAIAVICQYQIELDFPLFNVLVEMGDDEGEEDLEYVHPMVLMGAEGNGGEEEENGGGEADNEQEGNQ